MSSHLVFAEENGNRHMNLNINQTYEANELQIYPLLYPNIELQINTKESNKEEGKVKIIISNIKRIEILSSSFEIIVINSLDKSNEPEYIRANSVIIQEKETEDKNIYYNMVFTFEKKEEIFKKVRIYLFYVPKLTDQFFFLGEGEGVNKITYQTIQSKSQYTIRFNNSNNKYEVNFETSNEPPITNVYIVKIIDSEIIEYRSIQTKEKPNTTTISLEGNVANKPIYCGIIELLFPINENNLNISPLSPFEYITHTVPTMPQYNVRYGYDEISGSIVFEFLKNDDETDEDEDADEDQYDHIGVEICTPYGWQLKTGFGHISSSHAIVVRFSPKDINRIGDFSGTNITNICFSRDRLFKHEGLPRSYASPEDYKALKFLRNIFDLFINYHDYFNFKAQHFVLSFASEPQSVSVQDFYNLIFDDKPNLSIFEFKNPYQNMDNIISKIMKPGNFLIKNNSRKEHIRNGFREKNIQYQMYLMIIEENKNIQIKKPEETNTKIQCAFFIKQRKDDDEVESLPIYNYYSSRKEMLFYPKYKFFPIQPFAVHPQFTPSFQYRKHEISKNRVYLIKYGDKAKVTRYEINIFYNKFNEDFYIIPVHTSNLEEFKSFIGELDQIQEGRAYLCIKKDTSEKEINFEITFMQYYDSWLPHIITKVKKSENKLLYEEIAYDNISVKFYGKFDPEQIYIEEEEKVEEEAEEEEEEEEEEGEEEEAPDN